jgi:hydroxymethylpyrimidine kinase/phosphomethylpyrimidine kinase/thiamine-phosphate diphosphorylase
LVTDRSWHNDEVFLERVEESLKNGTSFLQLREKKIDEDLFFKRALEMKTLAKKYDVPFVINDNVKVAVDCDADGIHIGQGDMAVLEVRNLIGKGKILGVSVGSVEQAKKAEAEGADYLGVGAVFPTGTKKDANDVKIETLSEICSSVNIPVVAIGGISRSNILKLQGTGISGAAVVSAILGQENIPHATTDLLRLCKQLPQSPVPKVLTIAGSDCSGGAGIQADLKTIAAHSCYGMSVITALTAQNTTGVYGIENCKVDFIENQMDCIFTDIVPHSVKIGMVSSAEIIKSIANKLEMYKPNNVVVDPVMVSTSGSRLLEADAIKALCEDLLPMATIITPNLSEAELLCGFPIKTSDDMINGAKEISKFYKGHILVKGGHLEENANDLLFIDGKSIWLEGEKIDNDNTHGTGCTLSSAIASHLAMGYDVEESVRKSKEYITGALKNQMNLGLASGPLNHMYVNEK